MLAGYQDGSPWIRNTIHMRVKSAMPAEDAAEQGVKPKKTVQFKDLKSRTKRVSKRVKTEEEESEEEGEVRDNEPLSPTVGEKEEDPDQPQTQAWPSDEEAWNTAEDGSADKENQEPNAPRPDADENWELALRRDAQEHWTQSDKKSQPY